MLFNMLIAAILTCCIETSIMLIFLNKEQLKYLTLNVILINLITNLTLNLLILLFVACNIYHVWFVIIAELIIPIIEYFMFRYYYSQINQKKLFLLCWIANIASVTIGLLL